MEACPRALYTGEERAILISAAVYSVYTYIYIRRSGELYPLRETIIRVHICIHVDIRRTNIIDPVVRYSIHYILNRIYI